MDTIEPRDLHTPSPYVFAYSQAIDRQYSTREQCCDSEPKTAEMSDPWVSFSVLKEKKKKKKGKKHKADEELVQNQFCHFFIPQTKSDSDISPEERGLMLFHTASSLFEWFYMPQNTSTASTLLVGLLDGIFRIAPMSYIPARQQVLALRSFKNAFDGNIMADRSLRRFPKLKKITPAGDKQEDDAVPHANQIIPFIMARLRRAGLRPAGYISRHAQPETGFTSSLFVTGGPGRKGKREAPLSLVLRLTRKKDPHYRGSQDMIVTINGLGVTIGDLIALPPSDDSQAPTVDACVKDIIILQRGEPKDLRKPDFL
ncbi:hypothetical protein J7T55_005246 [Diaporthe amygdali]|uniref:uncharacterized protein n=1 Tax=Phomopsis amygdali TaxID=1214568 RepID=UPI0022FF2C93|nr:uncharacterized protein J7T55_005246 [Diaporthe amygdali]KAJ0100740.1 hypothetical protein J7T55_005246 [Diaporthe amygdali]